MSPVVRISALHPISDSCSLLSAADATRLCRCDAMPFLSSFSIDVSADVVFLMRGNDAGAEWEWQWEWSGNWLRWVFKPCAIIDVSAGLDPLAVFGAASAIGTTFAQDLLAAPRSPMAKCEPHFRKVGELSYDGTRRRMGW